MRLLPCLLTLSILAGPALAQPVAPAPAPAPAPSTPTLTPPQAQQVLDVLRDDKKRAEFTAVLDSMVRVVPAPATSLPLEPDSLGEQLLVQATRVIETTGQQLAVTLNTVNDLPLLSRWILSQAQDPAARARIFDALWRLLVVLAVASAGEWLVQRVLRRLRMTVSAWAPWTVDPQHETDAASSEHLPHTERAASVRRRSLLRAMGALRRVPYLIGRLLLDLLPIIAFGAIGFALTTLWLESALLPRATVRLVVQTYVITRSGLALVAMLASPEGPRVRLLSISDTAAAFITRWAWRLAIIGATGSVVAESGLIFGMYRTAHDTIQKLFALAGHACAIAMVLQARAPVARRIRVGGTGQGVWRAVRNRLADIWHLIAIFYIAALWLVWAVELRNGYTRLWTFFAVTTAVLALSRLLSLLAMGALDRLRPGADLAERHPALESRARFYYPVIRGLFLILLTLATGFALLEVWGIGTWAWLLRTGLGGRVMSAFTLIGFTIVLAVLLWEGVNAAVEHQISTLTTSGQLARAGRLRTLMPMLRTALLITIVIVVVLMALSEIGVNIAPLLAGAGVVGIAVGFGSQKLVQDLITGLFLLLENAMQVGDVVTLGGLSGTVEALSIRTIRLRALDGSVHIIPFSAVTSVTNQTRDYGYALVDISVGLNEEPEAVTAIVRTLAAEMRNEPHWATIILEPLDVMGVERFIDTAWVLRIRFKTQPSSRWAVGRELNRRVKLRFDELAIESPITSYRALSATPASPAIPEEQPA